MKIGLDIDLEKIFLEVGTGDGLNTTVTMTAKTARAVAGQLLANANALDTAMEEGNLGINDVRTES